ncbi:hypothetical protein GJ496_007687 [Pomphorhynchus laevis]|nr:hypothetical protein GJ496_007687 [Pomphorhynchus laevis]
MKKIIKTITEATTDDQPTTIDTLEVNKLQLQLWKRRRLIVEMKIVDLVEAIIDDVNYKRKCELANECTACQNQCLQTAAHHFQRVI